MYRNKWAVGLCFLWLLSGELAHGQITFQSATSGASPQTFNPGNAGAAGRVLIGCVASSTGAVRIEDGDGRLFTQIAQVNNSRYVTLFAQANPKSSSNSYTATGSTIHGMGLAMFTGVDLASVALASATSTALNPTSPSVDVTTSDSGLSSIVVDCVDATGINPTITVGSGQTSRTEYEAAAVALGISTEATTTPSTVTMSWIAGGTFYSASQIAAAALRPYLSASTAAGVAVHSYSNASSVGPAFLMNGSPTGHLYLPTDITTGDVTAVQVGAQSLYSKTLESTSWSLPAQGTAVCDSTESCDLIGDQDKQIPTVERLNLAVAAVNKFTIGSHSDITITADRYLAPFDGNASSTIGPVNQWPFPAAATCTDLCVRGSAACSVGSMGVTIYKNTSSTSLTLSLSTSEQQECFAVDPGIAFSQLDRITAFFDESTGGTCSADYGWSVICSWD